ncbi:MAG: hypothetical protein ACFFCO_08860 [Promethearchaeota archaeon]
MTKSFLFTSVVVSTPETDNQGASAQGADKPRSLPSRNRGRERHRNARPFIVPMVPGVN